MNENKHLHPSFPAKNIVWSAFSQSTMFGKNYNSEATVLTFNLVRLTF